MRITYDPPKDAQNRRLRDLPFELVHALDWSSAWIVPDDRQDYGERRYRVMGLIHDRLHVMVFTPRPLAIHVISLRKANQREAQWYEQKKSGLCP